MLCLILVIQLVLSLLGMNQVAFAIGKMVWLQSRPFFCPRRVRGDTVTPPTAKLCESSLLTLHRVLAFPIKHSNCKTAG
ncbi:hypothetical protein BDP55DRAFT_436547 [Colletotrichum godetiae]|uniref:Secreted protein n=1 Tax=Colletotrichum godetiae TaxID=1209918 RepID=A0AAJ0A6N7_9PEZI|nr:uncharacterized protein BDP55DRAFT_436547 [Colletotrichum godetiae]KAK1657492.1 hypothetical protein BDP55DRAFT_436547 [Colletotrichum godetiae]